MVHQERRATPKEQERYERRMARRNRKAQSRGRNYAAKAIGLGTALFFVVFIVAAASKG